MHIGGTITLKRTLYGMLLQIQEEYLKFVTDLQKRFPQLQEIHEARGAWFNFDANLWIILPSLYTTKCRLHWNRSIQLLLNTFATIPSCTLHTGLLRPVCMDPFVQSMFTMATRVSRSHHTAQGLQHRDLALTCTLALLWLTQHSRLNRWYYLFCRACWQGQSLSASYKVGRAWLAGFQFW